MHKMQNHTIPKKNISIWVYAAYLLIQKKSKVEEEKMNFAYGLNQVDTDLLFDLLIVFSLFFIEKKKIQGRNASVYGFQQTPDMT